MPVYSMTGFGSATASPRSAADAAAAQGGAPAASGGASSPAPAAGAAAVLVELRSVNGRFLDLSLRLQLD